MANIKSQIKRNRQNDKRRLRNRVYRGEARIAVKEARQAFEGGEAETSKKAILQAISALDKAAEKGVLHRNNVARRKSRLMRQYAKLDQAPAAAQPAVTEPVAEAAPIEEKKAAPRKRTAKAEKAEPKAEPKKAPAKKAATTRKTPAKK